MKKIHIVSIGYQAIGFDSAKEATEAYQAMAKGFGVTDNWLGSRYISTEADLTITLSTKTFYTDFEYQKEVETLRAAEQAKAEAEEAAKLAEIAEPSEF